MTWKAVIFVLGSLALVLISRNSLLHPRSHGFFRFLAWECILGLFLLNVDYWFRDPFSWRQIIAWILLFASIIPLVFGVRSLRIRGKPTEERPGASSLLAFEKTTALVSTGIYAYIRHPLYSSLLLLTWGIFFKAPNLISSILALLSTFFLFLTATRDERECIQYFGQAYRDYIQKTKRFIPYLF